MIIPDNLAPLPVVPGSEPSDESAADNGDCFVSEQTVKQLLVGPLQFRNTAVSFDDHDSAFADTRHPGAPFLSLVTEDVPLDDPPAQPFKPGGTHPALQPPRRPAPPQPRIEDRLPRARRFAQDRWWVLGMGAALFAIFCSGSFIEFLTQRPAPENLPPAVELQQLAPATNPPSSSLASADSDAP